MFRRRPALDAPASSATAGPAGPTELGGAGPAALPSRSCWFEDTARHLDLMVFGTLTWRNTEIP